VLPPDGGPKRDAPPVDAPRIDAPRVDAPKPKPDMRKLEGPKQLDAPKLDAPKLDKPRPDYSLPTVGSWVLVTKGKFMMGSPGNEPCRNATNESLHQVTIDHAFWIQTTEVTQAQYVQLLGFNPAGTNCGAQIGNDFPAVCVTWDQAAAYCNKLSQQEVRTPCYAPINADAGAVYMADPAKIQLCTGYRLPTDAEWEYAYRAESLTAFWKGPAATAPMCNQCYPEPHLVPYGWYCHNSGYQLQKVKTRSAAAWGIHDMAGNAAEWVNDLYLANLGNAPVVDPYGAPMVTAAARVLRNGSVGDYSGKQRAASRTSMNPTASAPLIGFRCVRTQPGEL
jgi:formylglycine-generating enzyme required for sulfatase activity